MKISWQDLVNLKIIIISSKIVNKTFLIKKIGLFVKNS